MTPKMSSVYSFVILSFALITSGCQPRIEVIPVTVPKVKMPYGNPDDDDSGKKTPKRPTPSTPENEAQRWEQFLTIMDNSDGVPFDVKQACATEVCGDVKVAKTPSNLLAQDINSNPAAVARYNTHFHPIFTRHLDLELEGRKKLLAKTRENWAQLANVALSKHEIALMNLLWTMENLSVGTKAFNVSVDPQTLEKKIKWDDELLKKELKSLNDNDYEYFKPLFLDLMTSQEIQLASYVSQVPIPIALKMVYPNQSLDESRQKLVDSLRQSLNDLKQTFPGLVFPELPAVELFAEGKDLEPDMVENLTTAITFIYIHRIAIQEPEKFNERPLSVQKLVNKHLSGEFLNKAEAHLSSPDLPKWREKALEQCRTNIIQTDRSAPSSNDLKNAENMIAKVRDHVLAIINDEMNLSGEQRQKLTNAVANLTFKYPYARDQLLSSHLRRAKSELKRVENDLAAIENYRANHLLIAMYVNLINNEMTSLEKKFNDLCKKYEPAGLTDHVVTGFGHVNISWQSVRFPELGASVVAHEFGHVISSNLKDEHPLKSLKACLSSRHGDDLEINKDEEDFADWIAARVARRARISGDSNVGNIGCMLLEHNSKRWGTRTGLTLRYPKEFNSLLRDPHSTDFYRLLQFQLTSEAELTSSCQNIADNYAPLMKIRCEAR